MREESGGEERSARGVCACDLQKGAAHYVIDVRFDVGVTNSTARQQ